MDFLDRIDALECDEKVRDNLKFILSECLSKEWMYCELWELIYVDHDICDTGLVTEDTELHEDITEIQFTMLHTYS